MADSIQTLLNSLRASRHRGGKVIGAVLVFRDVGEARKMAHQLSWQATQGYGVERPRALEINSPAELAEAPPRVGVEA